MDLFVREISKSFNSASNGEKIATLKDISFTARDGRFISIIGPSGCGKTTLLRMISGLERPDSGQILLGAHQVTGPLREVGYIFQDPTLLPWRTVVRNVEFGLETAGVPKEERRERALAALDLVELRDFGGFYPKEISGGMKQKASLAMALVLDPRILLMDEPFASLDCQTRNYMQVALLQTWEKAKKTVLFVTHNVEEAVFLGDEVICMTSRPARIGKIVQVDIPRPRDKTGPELNRIRKEVLTFLSEERAKSGDKNGMFLHMKGIY